MLLPRAFCSPRLGVPLKVSQLSILSDVTQPKAAVSMLQWEQYWNMHPFPVYTAPNPEWRAGPRCGRLQVRLEPSKL